jgi:hypothetical protein
MPGAVLQQSDEAPACIPLWRVDTVLKEDRAWPLVPSRDQAKPSRVPFRFVDGHPCSGA